jgi:hypothetical protein
MRECRALGSTLAWVAALEGYVWRYEYNISLHTLKTHLPPYLGLLPDFFAAALSRASG